MQGPEADVCEDMWAGGLSFYMNVNKLATRLSPWKVSKVTLTLLEAPALRTVWLHPSTCAAEKPSPL